MKILIHFRHFPVAMGRFFDWALRDLGHEVFSVGNYQEGKIPWGDQFNFPQYAFAPDYEIPEMDYPVESLLKEIDFKPDVIIQAADVVGLVGKAPCRNVLLKTDPHAVDYTEREKYVDHVFNMQKCYSKPGETWIPYAFYPPIHRVIPTLGKSFDVAFSGLLYDHRKEALQKMRDEGLKVFEGLGIVYEEYVQLYNSSLIAFNWSSKNDLPARFWEGMAMGCMMLTSIVPDLAELEFVEGTDYIGFHNAAEAAQLARYYSQYPREAAIIAENGRKKVQPHTYHARAAQMVEVIERL